MKHLENIEKLFAKGNVESPLLETFDSGELYISSGKILACDPLLTPNKEAFTQSFPKGKFPTFIHKERESNTIAYAEVCFSKHPIVKWEMALTQGQDTKNLEEEEIFGYPVESGMGCLMDEDTQTLTNQLEKELYEKKGNQFLGIYEEFFHNYFYEKDKMITQYNLLKPYSDKENNLLAFEAGYGEGFYASYIAYDKDQKPVKLISEFIEIVVD